MNLSVAPVSLDSIRAPIRDDLVRVDEVIRRRLHSDVALVRAIGQYIVDAGGKRIRPALLLLSAGALGVRSDTRHEMAAVIEFIHTATLLHDDVVDESTLRRGRKTANAEFGNAASVLVGDFLYSRSFQMMVEAGNLRVMQVIADATNVISEGEVLQLLNVNDPDTDEESYLRVIRYKTARLFEAATQVGAILAGASAPVEASLTEYGMRVGTAFQLIDDVLDYSGDLADMGKNLGDDLAEGKPTLPLIHALRQSGNEDERQRIRRAIEQGGLDEMEPILATIESTGALEYTRRLAQDEADQALTALNALPESPYKKGLAALARFAVERTS